MRDCAGLNRHCDTNRDYIVAEIVSIIERIDSFLLIRLHNVEHDFPLSSIDPVTQHEFFIPIAEFLKLFKL